MNVLYRCAEIAVTFAAALAAAALATFLWNAAAHSAPSVDWATCFRLAAILGTGLPVSRWVAGSRRCRRAAR
jgi:hypothetical protein